jgi:cell division control protein 6
VIYELPVELTKKDLYKMRQKIRRQNAVFSEKKYLDSLFLPSGIIGRKEEAEQILSHIESTRHGLAVPLVSIYGRSGSGKSTVVKFVCQNISDIASSAFVNLRKSKTIFGCANLILSELGGEPLKSAEGLHKVIDKIGSKIQSILGDKKLFVLALDEYDVIFSDIRGKPSDFVYKLLTLEENLREKGILLCIMTISNNALDDYNLDDRVKSRIGNSEVFFTPYAKDDLLAILRDRADKAFSISISDDILQYCADSGSLDHGDVRRET